MYPINLKFKMYAVVAITYVMTLIYLTPFKPKILTQKNFIKALKKKSYVEFTLKSLSGFSNSTGSTP